jgi:hypothetical protein
MWTAGLSLLGGNEPSKEDIGRAPAVSCSNDSMCSIQEKELAKAETFERNVALVAQDHRHLMTIQ